MVISIIRCNAVHLGDKKAVLSQNYLAMCAI